MKTILAAFISISIAVAVSAQTTTETTLITKKYDNISAPFFNNHLPQSDKQCQEFLAQQGILFSQGATAQYDARAHQLTLRNTAEEIKMADTLIGAWYEAVTPSRK